MRPTKNWKVLNSLCDTRIDPYQKTSDMTKKDMPCENEYKRLLQTADLFDFWRGSSRLWLYRSQQSFSRVSEATVLMEAAASQAN